jgi:hypothetical protein
LENVVCKEKLDPLVHQENQQNEVIRVHLVSQVNLELLVIQEKGVLKDYKVHKVFQVHKD